MAGKLQDTMEPDLTAEEEILDTTEPDLTMAEILLDTMALDPLATREASASGRLLDEEPKSGGRGYPEDGEARSSGEARR